MGTKFIMPLKMFLLLFIAFIMVSDLDAASITLTSPTNHNNCVTKNNLQFSWTIDNPYSAQVTNLTIKIFEDIGNVLKFEKNDFTDVATSFIMQDGILEVDKHYKWQVSATIGTDLVISSDYYFLIAVTPAFGNESYADNAICVGLNALFDWTSNTPNSYIFNMQLSKSRDFEHVINVQSTSTTTATATLEANTNYYWRLQHSTCTHNFSEIRTLKTIALPPTLTTPIDNLYIPGNDSFVKLVWKNNVLNVGTVNNYQLQIALDKNFTKKVIDTIVKKEFFDYSLDGNYYNKKYYWRVRTVDSNNSGGGSDVVNVLLVSSSVCTSEWTEVFNFRTMLKPVTPIAPADSAKCVLTNAAFIWEKANDTAYYQIWISNKADFKDTVKFVNITSKTKKDKIYDTAIVVLPKSNTLYYWKIRQYFDSTETDEFDNTSLWSEPHRFTTTIAPTTLLTPANNTMGADTNIVLKWKSIDTSYSYKLQISKSPNFETNAIIVSEITKDTNYRFVLKSDISKYYWRVDSRDFQTTGCISDFSEVFMFSTALALPKIISPGKPYPAETTDTLLTNNAVFKWNKVEKAVKYDIEYTTNKAAFDKIPSQIVYRYNIVDTVLEQLMLDTNKTYYWRIKANGEVYSSEWSPIHYFVTGYSMPTAITLLLPYNNARFVASQTEFKWESAAFAEKYELLVSDTNNFNDEKHIVINVTIDAPKLSYKIDEKDKLKEGAKYYWQMRAVNKNVFGPWSEVRSYTTVPPIPTEAVTLVEPADKEDDMFYDKVKFVWTDVANAQYYKLQVSKTEDFSALTLDTNVENKIQFTASKFEKLTNYFWRVAPGNDNGLGKEWSAVFSFKTGNESTIFDYTYTSFMNVTPNPANENAVCNFGLLKQTNVTMIIVDASGNVVIKHDLNCNEGNYSINLNANNLANGVYLCQLIANNKIIATTQFVVSK